MIKVYIIPHTHWDREWYFTNQTSNILLQRLGNDLLEYKVNKFTLDGQSSLLWDIQENSPSTNQKLKEKIKNKNLIVGPLFVQQDTFNTTAATTQMNIDFSKKVVGSGNTPKTMYMPDSFGFNEQLPQMFKLNKFQNFVFWRGIKPEDKKISNLFNWVGIDGTKIQASCMSNGYYTLGQYYPYNDFTKKKATDFISQLVSQVDELQTKQKQNCYFLPLGGDQAPYEHKIKEVVELANKNQNKYQFILGSYDDYFNNLEIKPKHEIDYALNYSGTSKIHRTIHSNRTDIKILFRECERLLHKGIRPLEVMFKSMGGKLLEEAIIERNAIIPILKSSAHDSLGSCNSDITNSFVKTRLEKTKNFLQSYIDIMVRDMNKIFAKKGKVIVYNQMPFERDILTTINISTANNKNISNPEGTVVEIECNDVSWKQHDPVWNHTAQIFAEKVQPFSWRTLDIYGKPSSKQAKEDFIKISNKDIEIFNTKINLLVELDDGDEFDFSTPAVQKQSKLISNKITDKIQTQTQQLIKTETTVEFLNKKQTFYINWTKVKDQINAKINFVNKLKNVRISISVPRTSKTVLSRHLAFIEQKLDNIKNWKELGYKDNPINSFANDGLVQTQDISIFTRGNNEVSFNDKNIKVILLRSVDYLGKPELIDRPGVASGLPQKVATPDATLMGENNFEIQFTQNVNIIQKLNSWNALDICSFAGQTNPIIQKYDRFVINEIQTLNKPDIKIGNYDFTKLLFSYLKVTNNNQELMFSNPTSTINGGLKPYEIQRKSIK